MGREITTPIDINLIPNEEVRNNALKYQERVYDFLNKIRKHVKIYIEANPEDGACSGFYHLSDSDPIFTDQKSTIYSVEITGGIHPTRYDIIWAFDLTGLDFKLDNPMCLRDGTKERVLYFSFSQTAIKGNRESLRSMGNINIGICGNKFTAPESAEGNCAKIIHNAQTVYELDSLFNAETAAKTILEVNKIYDEYKVLKKMQREFKEA